MHRLSHTVASRSRICSRSGATPTRAAGGRVFRALTFPHTRVTRPSAETLYYPPAGRRLRNRRDATSRDRTCESVLRDREMQRIRSDRFRQSATARNCLFRCADLSALLFASGRFARKIAELSRTVLVGSPRILKSLSLSFNIYDAAGSNAPGPTGAAGSNRRIGMTRPDTRGTRDRAAFVTGVRSRSLRLIGLHDLIGEKFTANAGET